MAEKISPVLPPVEWDLPEPKEESDHTANTKSFNDDHVAARLSVEEQARIRVSTERMAVEQPRDLLKMFEKVEEAAPFRPAEDENPEAQRARRDVENQRQPTASPVAGRRRRTLHERATDNGENLTKVEQRLESLLSELHQLDTNLEELQQAVAALMGQANTKLSARQQAAAVRLARIELQAKYALQMLIAGGVGFTFLSDPRLAFKRLFDSIRRWPKCVRPGRRPETDEEFDAFLAWVFEPPTVPSPPDDMLAVW